MAGGEQISARNSPTIKTLLLPSLMAIAALICGSVAYSDALYKYLGEDDVWIYTDRKPEQDRKVEVRELETSFSEPEFSVTYEISGRNIEFVARNAFHSPVEIQLEFIEIMGVSYPDPDEILRWVVDPRSDQVLLNLEVLEEASAPQVHYRFEYMPGDPTASHLAGEAYQAPFSVGLDFPITQAYPDSISHQSLDSQYAVDIAMPTGTAVLAARGGVVVAVASDNYRGGLDKSRDGPAANIIRILHEDGTFSLYAHLSWNSIRVLPGDRVTAGQYIADSGNTGFSSGPHLHFSVQRNAGLAVESVPFVFRGSSASTVIPATGDVLIAYP
jgi:murein DD-endopeptidase MepM/ murein hydrolase activator NlpD